jgi:hypothetical protein
MYNEKIKTTLDEAEELFDAAKEELYKPEEDVVHYMVCHNAFKSVNQYLTGYLLNHGVEIYVSMSLAALLDQCRLIDKKFNDLNLDLLYTFNEDENIWMDIDNTLEYMELAAQTRKMVGVI